MSPKIAITGLGAVSAIGLDIETMRNSLRNSRGGIGSIDSFSTDDFSVHHAAEIKNWPSREYFPDNYSEIDRTAQLAIVSARQAVADANLSPEELSSGRVALIFGICSGGIGSPESPGILRTFKFAKHQDNLRRLLNLDAFVHTDAVAADLGIIGPRLTVSTACASSASAMSCAITMLRSGRADTVIVGGSDAWSLGIYAGFYSLGALATQPCSPFSRDIGVTFGEGGGCIVLESSTRAKKRGIKPKAFLLGCGCTSDAHHITSPDPSGEGLIRAIQLSLNEASVTASSLDYINAHGTGTNDNDVTETVALHRLFDGRAIPPVSSSKSFFGHTMGAAGVLELIASIICMQDGFAPPTLNFSEARLGCDLDYIPNKARSLNIDTFMSMSAAFGGINAVVIGGRADSNDIECLPSHDIEEKQKQTSIVVSGIGVVSPIGHGIEQFRTSLTEGVSGVKPITRFDSSELSTKVAATIEQLPVRLLAPTADLRRADQVTRYAVVAAMQALKDAGIVDRIAPEKIGLFVAMSAGPVESSEKFSENLEKAGVAQLSARFFPPIVISTVSGQICQACRIRGSSFTFIDGVGAGLSALAHAYDTLQQHEELDAILVVSADEISRLSVHVHEQLDLISNTSAPFSAVGKGYVPGEGAAALVLERASSCHARSAKTYGRIAGVGMGGEACSSEAVDPNATVLVRAAADALKGGELPDLIYGLSRGVATHDAREATALKSILGDSRVPVGGLNAQLGLSEATSGLYAAIAALLGLRYGEAYPIQGLEKTGNLVSAAQQLDILNTVKKQHFKRTMALGSSQHGNCAAVLFEED